MWEQSDSCEYGVYLRKQRWIRRREINLDLGKAEKQGGGNENECKRRHSLY
jgi:hypothetical protein